MNTSYAAYRDTDKVRIAVALGDRAELRRLARSASRDTARLAAALALHDVEALRDLASSARRETVRSKAAAALGDTDTLAALARTSRRPAARALALKALRNEVGTADPIAADAVRFVRGARLVGLTDAEIEHLIRRTLRRHDDLSDPRGGDSLRHHGAGGDGGEFTLAGAPCTTASANPNPNPGNDPEKE
ncbi:MAG: hypothetical protein L6R43_08805 [Planctomycetes bacterium]|nr:hypothetical protein [Planctomycetota bacterium]